jgi:hypothetical protein
VQQEQILSAEHSTEQQISYHITALFIEHLHQQLQMPLLLSCAVQHHACTYNGSAYISLRKML